MDKLPKSCSDEKDHCFSRKEGEEKMKAAIFEKPNKLVIKEVSMPKCKSNEVIVKVEYCGVCATDVHTLEGNYIGKHPYPLIPGHEFSGTIHETGKKVDDLKIGEKVAVDPIVYCDKCDFCKENKQNHCQNSESLGTTIPGGFAEYVAVPEKNIYIFDNVSFKEASLAEPLACVVYSHERTPVKLDDQILIFGAGPLGLLHLQVAKNSGATNIVVCDLKDEKLNLAKKLGADITINPKKDSDLLSNYLSNFDMVIEATGVPEVVEQSVKYLKNTGKLMIFGVSPQDSRININPYEIYRRDIEIVGTFALNKTLGKALNLIDQKIIKTEPLVSDVLSLDKLPNALKMLKNGEADGKIQINLNLD